MWVLGDVALVWDPDYWCNFSVATLPGAEPKVSYAATWVERVGVMYHNPTDFLLVGKGAGIEVAAERFHQSIEKK